MEENEKPYLLTFRCNACEYGPCVASCERRPKGCLCENCARFDPEWTGATWKRVRNVADDLFDLFDWREGSGETRRVITEDGIREIYDEGAQEKLEDGRWYPDWYYTLTQGDCYDGRLVWALHDVCKRADYLESPWEAEENRASTLKRYKKEEIARAFAGYGFAAGLLYGEWRRKICKENDWEIVDDGEDVD